MKNIFVSVIFCIALVAISKIGNSQEKQPDPYILSVMPDSLLSNYEYSQTVFIVGTSAASFKLSGSPTEKAIADMKKQIIATCKLNKMEGFILNQLVFAMPADYAEVIGYGTMIRKKPKSSPVE